MRGRGGIDIVESAYRVDLDETSWLEQIGERAPTIVEPGAARWGATVSVAKPTPTDPFYRRARLDVPYNPELSRRSQVLEDVGRQAASQSKDVRAAHMRTVAQTSSEWADKTLPPGLFDHAFGSVMGDMGIGDVLNIQGFDLSGMALVVQMPLAARTALHPKQRQYLSRIATHLSAALRLREMLGSRPALDTAEAIFDARGRCVHASESAQSETASKRLREAAKAVDKARGKLSREDPELALELWRGLFNGRWSLLEVFDTDARRFMVAHKNDPQVAADRALTRREKQIAGLAALGYSDRLISYGMGLSQSTVRTHLRRAMKKMRVKDRGQLIELASVLVLNDKSK